MTTEATGSRRHRPLPIAEVVPTSQAEFATAPVSDVGYRIVQANTTQTSGAEQRAMNNEIGFAAGLNEYRQLRAEGEVVSDVTALRILLALEERGDLPLDEASGEAEQLIALAAAGMVFSADQRLFPTPSGLGFIRALRHRFG